MAIVTICAAECFWRAVQDWAARLTLEGHVVLHRGAFPAPGANLLLRERLDRLQLLRVEMADRILVLDLPIDGVRRLEQATVEEVRRAAALGTPIECLSAREPGWTEADCLFVPSPAEALPALPLPANFPVAHIPQLARFAQILARPRPHRPGDGKSPSV